MTVANTAHRSTKHLKQTISALAITLSLGGPLAATDLSENQMTLLTDSSSNDVHFYDEASFRDHLETENLTTADPPLIVPAADFNGDGGTMDTFFPFSSGYIQGSSSDCLLAPVYLPDGAIVNNLFAYLYDDDLSDIFMTLYRTNNGTVGGAEVMASINTTGESTSIQIPGDSSVTHDIVDNRSYSYYLTACLSSGDHRINAAWIYFDPPVVDLEASFLDVFSSTGGTRVVVQENNAAVARRQLVRLENNGPPEFVLVDNDRSLTWKFGTRSDSFEINRGNSGQTEMLLRANGDLQIAGTLSQGSSRTLKEDFRNIDPRKILDQVNDLPLLDWTYKTTEETDRHFGPMAEDFHETFGLGDNPERLAPGDAAGIALAAIQGLDQEKDEEIAALRAELDELKKLLTEIKRQ